jgi:hypothetical protein
VTDAASPPKPERRATSYGIPIVARAPAAPTSPPAASEEVATTPERALSEGEPAMVVDKPPVDLPPPMPSPAPTRQTTLGMPAIRPAATLPFGVPTLGDSGAARAPQPPRRAPAPSTPPPPRPRIQTPVAPLPIARPPAMTSSSPQLAPPADERVAPAVSAQAATTTTEPATPLVTSFEDSDKAYVGAPPGPGGLSPPPAAAARSGGMRASEIMAAIPDEDWTMTPDAAQPTVLPAAKEPPVVVAATTSPKGPPTGDWTMSADPSAAGGWTEPAKVQIAPEMRVPATGNPVFSIPEKALIAVAWEDKPTNIGAKIEVDPTLMEPLQPMPAESEAAVSAPPVVMLQVMPPVLPPSGSQPQMAAAYYASPYAIPTPAPGALAIPTPAPMPAPLPPPPLAPQFPTPMPGFAPAYAGTLATGVPSAPYPPQQMVSDGGSGFFHDSEPVAFAGDAFVAEPGARSRRRGRRRHRPPRRRQAQRRRQRWQGPRGSG